MICRLLIIHAVFFAVVLILRLLKVLDFPLPFLSMALFLPFAGEISCLIMELLYRSAKAGSRHENLELMRQEGVWKRSAPRQAPEPENVIPVSDALALDNEGTRRDVLMQVIMQEENQPEQSAERTRRYADVLTQAKSSGDTEVVHYAATAITHMQDTIEAKMHACDNKLAKDPDNDETLAAYADLIERGLQSEVWSGQMQAIQQTHLRQILAKRYALFHREEDGLRLVQAMMDAGLYGDAWSSMLKMGIAEQSVSGLSDAAYLTRLRYAYETREEKAFQQLLAAKKAEGGFQSEEIRSVIEFFGSQNSKEDEAQ